MPSSSLSALSEMHNRMAKSTLAKPDALAFGEMGGGPGKKPEVEWSDLKKYFTNTVWLVKGAHEIDPSDPDKILRATEVALVAANLNFALEMERPEDERDPTVMDDLKKAVDDLKKAVEVARSAVTERNTEGTCFFYISTSISLSLSFSLFLPSNC